MKTRCFSHRVLVPALAIAWCAGTQAQPVLTPLAGPGDAPPAPWRFEGLPMQTKPRTAFSVVKLDSGERVLRVEADKSYGNLVHPVANVSAQTLTWRWRLDQPVAGADLRVRQRDDIPLKVCAFFDLPMERIPFWERQGLRLARGAAQGDLPGATVCYVWDSTLAPGTALDNAFTRRVRQIVLRGPEAYLKQWFSERRDVRQDFLKLFADEAQDVPALVGIAVGADADNTQGRSLGYVIDLMLQ